MADRYWVGGSGIWNSVSTANWAATSNGSPGASVPSSVDDVYFDTNSGSTYTVTFGSGNPTCKTLRITKPSGTADFTDSGFSQLTIFGSFLILSSSGISFTVNTLIIQPPSSTPVSVDLNGVDLTYTTVIQLRAVNLLSDFNAPNAAVDFNTYSLDLSTFTLTCLTFRVQNIAGRTLTFGAGAKVVVRGSGSSAFSGASPTNLAVTVGSGSSIEMASASAKTFAGVNNTWPGLINTGTGALTILGSNTFSGNLEVRAIPSTLTLQVGNTQTVTGDVILNGTTSSRITLNSSSPGTLALLSKASGTVTATGMDIRDSYVTGGASWVAFDSINSGNNLGWTFVTGTANMFQLF